MEAGIAHARVITFALPALSTQLANTTCFGCSNLYAEDKADTPFRNIRRWHGLDFTNWVDDGVILRPRWWSWWESQDVSSPVVWREEQTWYMLYEGRGGRKNIITYFSVLWHGLLTGTIFNPGGKIGFATSADGIRWVRHQLNPVFIG